MSGPYSLAAAARYPDRIAAAASFHGTWLVSDAEESPHLTFGKSKGEIYISCAEHDEVAPLDMVEELRGHFEASGADRRARDPPWRAPRLRLPGTLVLRQARGGTALGTTHRPLPPPPRLTRRAPPPAPDGGRRAPALRMGVRHDPEGPEAPSSLQPSRVISETSSGARASRPRLRARCPRYGTSRTYRTARSALRASPVGVAPPALQAILHGEAVAPRAGSESGTTSRRKAPGAAIIQP